MSTTLETILEGRELRVELRKTIDRANRQTSVLIVEDSNEDFELQINELIPLNLNLVRARDAHEAIAMLKAAQFDYMILDLKLPGMDGIEMLRNCVLEGVQIPTTYVATGSYKVYGPEASRANQEPNVLFVVEKPMTIQQARNSFK